MEAEIIEKYELKSKRIQAEKRRLKRLFSGISERKRKVSEGLVERAAYMRIQLEDAEQDIIKNGMTEKFSQGTQEPYDRKRPIADLYAAMNTSYQKIIKQLIDLLPPEEKEKVKLDPFMAFVTGDDTT